MLPPVIELAASSMICVPNNSRNYACGVRVFAVEKKALIAKSYPGRLKKGPKTTSPAQAQLKVWDGGFS